MTRSRSAQTTIRTCAIVNVKLRREAVIPIGPALVEQLRRQEKSLTATLRA